MAPRRTTTRGKGRGRRKGLDKDAHGPVCAFCDKPNGEDFVGELLSKGDLHAHYFCMLFSSGLHQRGQDSEPLRGFLDADVRSELRRGTRLSCSFCKKKSATVGCCLRACKKVFHMPCGVSHNCLLQFFGDFRVYCATHRPQQNVVPLDTGGGLLCPICAEEMSHPSVSVLVTPCCRQLFHRTCIQKQALSAGSHFFRCGHCNNQEAFQAEMQEHGIYVPERDASWEREPRAFEELLFHYSHCDAPRCCCPMGRDHSEDGGRWKVVVCDGCGSQGVHASCGNVASLVGHWLCSTCRQVISRAGAAACRDVVPVSRPTAPPSGVEVIEIDSEDDDDDLVISLRCARPASRRRAAAAVCWTWPCTRRAARRAPPCSSCWRPSAAASSWP